jgi:transcriptional regulator with XRE-family HTH domain
LHRNNRIYHEIVHRAKLERPDVAACLNVSRSTVLRYSNNSIVPEDSKLMLLAERNGLQVNLETEAITPLDIKEGEVSNATLERDILRSLHRLDPDKQRDCLLALRHMVSAAQPPIRYRAPTAADVKAQIEADILSEVDRAIAGRSPPDGGPKAKPSTPSTPPRTVR